MTDGLLVYIYSARPRVRKVLPSALPFEPALPLQTPSRARMRSI